MISDLAAGALFRSHPSFMRTTGYLLAALLSFTHGIVSAQVPPGEARARLAVIIGSWTIAGQEASYSEICEWYHNNSFVVCNSEEKAPQGVRKSVSILGFSEISGMYTYYNYGSSGGSRTLNGFLRGDEFLFTGERSVRGDMIRYQVSMKPTDSGFLFREDRSANGAPWVMAAQADYVRRK